MTPDCASRRPLLTAALGFAPLDTRGKPAPPEVQTMRDAHAANERSIRAILTAIAGASAVSANSPFNAPLDEVLRGARGQITTARIPLGPQIPFSPG